LKSKPGYYVLDYGEAYDYSRPFLDQYYNLGIFFYEKEIIYGWEKDYGVRSYEFKLRISLNPSTLVKDKKSHYCEDIRFIHTMDLKSLPRETIKSDHFDNFQFETILWEEFLNQVQPELFNKAKARLERRVKGVIPPPKYFSDSYITTPHEFLQFTEESAPSWGGPFQLGDFFGACIEKKENNKLEDFPIGPIEENWSAYDLPYEIRNKAVLDPNKVYSYKPDKKRRIFNSFTWDLKLHLAKKYTESFNRYPISLDRYLPFSLLIFGNDDTSFFKHFGTEEDREKEINYLRMMQPLDFRKDILERGYCD